MSERVPFYYRITAGIRITVRPRYLKERSNPLLGQFVFAYHIRIENVGEQAAQLRTRRWLIHDEAAGDTEVEGEGVVGEQPHLLPGQGPEYRSFCVLKAPNGWMEGSYRFVRDDGSGFTAVIPRFTLDAEPRADTVS
ncbi:MAG: Co2+/Mg2+ efflux protein ApaG [Gemmatimonas sp.]|uniref:Co2+/Mg2+ efflux protein ApaG n=1 Tax=Gemmatimonas sp. TaxID=1962908 RepID=UPI00391FC34A